MRNRALVQRTCEHEWTILGALGGNYQTAKWWCPDCLKEVPVISAQDREAILFAELLPGAATGRRTNAKQPALEVV